MAVKIKFDTSHNPELPTFVLATRSGKKLGKITNISNVHIGDNLNAPMDISFSVHKLLDIDPVNFPDMKNGYLVVSNSSGVYGKIKLNSGSNIFMGVYDELNYGRNASEIWDDIKNFRKIWIPEWDKWFTLTYSIDESNETIKNVSLVPNSEFELSNVNVHNLEINTESDILREDYKIPTVFYNPDHPEASLLHRILSYTKGFVIKHVDDSLKDIQRTFALDGNNIYDTFQQVAEEIQCLFVFDSGTYADDGSIERAISAYDLRTYCNSCGYRGDYYDHCPKCESKDIIGSYGEDTTIFVDNEALADSINLTTDTDSVKNCFRLLSGDGLMDAAIIATNPNGSQYIWYFTDEMMEDMSFDLKTRLGDYNNDYEYYQNDYTIPMSNAELTLYNTVVSRYTEKKEELQPIDDIVGYAELMNALYDVMDFQIYLEAGLLPVVNFDTNAQEQADKITPQNMSYVAVQSLNSKTAATTVNSAVEAAVKILIDQRYTAKIYSSTYESGIYRWTGSFTVTANNNKEDIARTGTMSIYITDTYEIFAKQRIEKAIAGSDKNSYSMVEAFSLDIDEFDRRLKMYSRAGLRSYLESCNAAIGVMVELGISNPTSAVLVEGGLDAYYKIYLPYVLKLRSIENEVSIRDEEIAAVQDFYDMLIAQKHDINEKLDINTFLGDELAVELNSYKMEDDYSNSNYISEGLDNAHLFKRAAEFVEIANNEIRKAATEHHSISTTMHNLLTIKEFEPLVDHFAVGNWIRIKVDGKIYRVKLLSYTIDFDNIGSLQVDFSDTIGSGDASLADVFASAQSMAKSYDSVKYQAVSGAAGRATLNTWVQKGLDLTTVRVTNAENQTLQLDQNGMSMLQYDDVTQGYTNYGSRWINTTLAFTKDNWETTETALGRFEYWDPKTDMYQEGYGVVAKQLIGNIILGNEVGIYNQGGSITIDENGITLTANGDDGKNMSEFTIQRQYTDSQGQTKIEKQLYIDENGKLIYKGEVFLESGKTIEEQMQSFTTEIKEAKTLLVTLSNESHVVPTDKDGNNGDYNDCNTQVYVFYGSADVTNSAVIIPAPSTGITGNWNASTKTYYVSDMTSDSGYIAFTVQFDDLQVVKNMSISKAKAGGGERGVSISNVVNYYLGSNQETGVTRPSTDETGGWTSNPSTITLSDSIPYMWNYEKIVYSSGNPTYTTPVIISRYATKGADAVRYDIVVSHAAVMKTETGSYSPLTLTVAAQSQRGEGGLEEYAGRFMIEVTINNSTWTTSYTSGNKDETQVSFSIPSTPANILAIRCSLYKAGSYDTLLDRQTIPVATSGVNGLNQATVYLFQRSATRPDAPSSGLVYSFSSGVVSGSLEGWKQTIETGSNPLWVTIASASSRENTDTITVDEWSDVAEFATNGTNGDSGYNQATLYLYRRSASNPGNISSSASLKYDFLTGVLTGIPSGWSTSIPTVNGNPCWVTTAAAISKDTSVTIAGSKWSSTVKLAEDGADGYTVILTNENHTFNGNAKSANPDSVDCQVIAYKGTTQVTPTITSLSTGGVKGITATINSTNKSIFTVAVTNELTTSGVVTVNISVDGKAFTREFSYSIAFAGLGIRSSTVSYGVSSSPTVYPAQWYDADHIPTASQSQYLWTRTVTDYVDEALEDTVSYSYSYQGKNGGTGTSVSVKFIQYQEGTSATTPPTGTWVDSDNMPTVKGGNYLWTKTTFSDNKVAYGVAQQGVGIQSIVEYYKASTSATSAPNKNSFTTTVQTTDATNRFLWNFERTTFTNGTVEDSALRVIGTHGEDGKPARRYDLIVTPFAIVKDSATNTYNPTSITFSAQYQDGTDSPSSYSGYYKVETTTNGTTWTNQSFSGTTYIVPTSISGLSAIRVSLYLESGKTTLLDQQTIPIVSNGKNGEDGKDGKDGANGLNQATVYMYKRSAVGSVPSIPSGSLTYTFNTHTISGTSSALNGWSQNTSASGTNPFWVIAATASSVNATDTIANTEWSTPIQLEGTNGFDGKDGESGRDGKDGKDGKDGTNGVDGLNQATIYLYQRSSSTPSKPTGSLTYTFSTGDLNSIPSGWSRTVPTNNGDPCWVTTNVAISNTATAIISSAWADVVKLVENGIDGEDGADAYTVILTNESHTFSGTNTSAKESSTTCNVIAYKGATQVATTIGTITGQVTGLTTSIQNNDSTSAGFTVKVTTALTAAGVLTVPVTVDGKTFNKNFSWTIALSGNDGLPGKDGVNGKSNYVHIKYSLVVNPTDAQMTETPSDYIGICVNENVTDPTTASSYTWSKWIGKDGESGLPGDSGYVHFAYANSADGKTDFSTSWFEGAKYIGVYSDHSSSDSTVYSDYEWSLIKGDKGDPTASYTIEASDTVVKKSFSNTLYPDFITFNAYYREGTAAARTAYSGRFVILESIDGTTFTQKYPTGTPKNESSVKYTISSPNVKLIKCILYAANSTTTQLDVQTVAVISDVEGIKIGSRNLIHMSDTLIYKDYGFFGNLLGNNKNLVTNELKKIIAKYGTYPEEMFEEEPEE